MLSNERGHNYVYITGLSIQKKTFKNMTLIIRHTAARKLAAALAAAFTAVATPAVAQQPPAIILTDGGIPSPGRHSELKDIAQQPHATDEQKITAVHELSDMASRPGDDKPPEGIIAILVELASGKHGAATDTAVEMLTRLANQPQQKLREIIARNLYLYTPHGANDLRMLDILRRLADDNDAAVRASAYSTAAKLTRHATIAPAVYDIVAFGTDDTAPNARQSALIGLQTVAKNMPARRNDAINILRRATTDSNMDTRITAGSKLVIIYIDHPSDHDKIVPVIESIYNDSPGDAANLIKIIMLWHNFRHPDLTAMTVRIAESKLHAALTASDLLLRLATKDESFAPAALRALPFLLENTGRKYHDYEIIDAVLLLAKNHPAHAPALIDIFAAFPTDAKWTGNAIPGIIGKIGAAAPHATTYALDTLAGFFNHPSPEVRTSTVFTLYEISLNQPASSPQVFEGLALFLNNDLPVAVNAALEAMSAFARNNISYAEPAGSLMLTMLDHKDEGIRRATAYTISNLCALTPPLVLPFLDHAERFANHADEDMRNAAPYMLQNIYNAQPQTTYSRIIPLLEKLSSDTEDIIRRNTASAIGNILAHNAQPNDTLAGILKLLAQDKNYSVSTTAKQSLEEYARILRLNALQNALPTMGEIEKQMPAALTDAALAQMVLDDAIRLLETPDTAIQQRMTDAVGRLGTAHASLATQAIDALAAMNTAGHPPARLFAVQNIGTIGTAHRAQAEFAINALSAFSRDTDEGVINRALAAATIIGKRHPAAGDEARALLTPFTKSNDATLRRTTEHQLKMLPPAP
jgi:HEAT repeat protein